MFHEGLDGLCRSTVVLSAYIESVRLRFSLEFQSTKEFFAGLYGNHDGSVGKWAVSTAVTHAVGGKCPWFRSAGHQHAAGAHAETVGTAGFVQCRCGEKIFRSSGEACIDTSTQLPQVYQLLGVFHTNAHGESLAFKGYAPGLQHLVNVPARMPSGKDQRFAALPRTLRCGVVFYLDGRNATVLDFYICQGRIKMDLPTQSGNFCTDFPEHQHKSVGTDVGLREGDNILVHPEIHHVVQDLFRKCVPAPGVELAVAESSGSALAKENITAGVELSVHKKPAYVAESFLYGLSLLVKIYGIALA